MHTRNHLSAASLLTIGVALALSGCGASQPSVESNATAAPTVSDEAATKLARADAAPELAGETAEAHIAKSLATTATEPAAEAEPTPESKPTIGDAEKPLDETQLAALPSDQLANAKPVAVEVAADLGPGFQFPEGPEAKLLREQLVTPPAKPLPPLAPAATKRDWTPLRVAQPKASLPPANVARASSVLDEELPVAGPQRAVVDQPLLNAPLETPRPARPALRVAPLANTTGPDPAAPPKLPYIAKQKDSGPDLTNDPTAEPLAKYLLQPLPPVRVTPLVLAPLSTPDPYEHLRGMQRRRPTAETDPAPATTAPLPSRPTP